MSEQTPVEELIGWREDWPDGSAPYKVWWNEHGSLPLGTHATVDDLADWLDGLGWEWVVFRTGDRVVNCRKNHRRTVATSAPTILAALEAAVRAVHEQEATDAAST